MLSRNNFFSVISINYNEVGSSWKVAILICCSVYAWVDKVKWMVVASVSIASCPQKMWWYIYYTSFVYNIMEEG